MHYLLDNNGAGENFPWLLLVLFAGFLIWSGHRLREDQPGLANGLGQLGRSVGLLTFFGIISNHLPTNIGWVPGLCCAFTLLAQLLLLGRVMHHPIHHYHVGDNAPWVERRGQRMMDLHPNYRYELLKAMLGQGIAAIVVLTIIYKHSFPSLVSLVLISTSVGLSAIWAGLQMRDILPYFATGVKKLGAAIVVFTFFGLVSMHLPASVVCVPWICCVLVLSLVAALLS